MRRRDAKATEVAAEFLRTDLSTLYRVSVHSGYAARRGCRALQRYGDKRNLRPGPDSMRSLLAIPGPALGHDVAFRAQCQEFVSASLAGPPRRSMLRSLEASRDPQEP